MVVLVASSSTVHITLLNLTTIFQCEILRHFKACSHIVNIFDTTQLDFITYLNPNSAQNYFTNIILPTSISSNVSVQLPYLLTRFSSPCALTIQDMTKLLVTFSADTVQPESATPWAPPALLGSPLKEFHVFLIRSCEEKSLSIASSLMRKIFRSFIVQSCKDSQTLFRMSSDGQRILNFGKFPTKFGKSTFFPLPNFNLEPFNIVTCATCPKAIDVYKITGYWTMTFVGAVYEFSIRINATFESEEVLTYPRDEPDEDGQWDDWFQPVIEGSAAVTLLIRVSMQKSQLAYVTLPGGFDGIIFITDKPKRVPGSQSLLKLFSPFTIPVRVACAISVVFMFGVIELTLKIRRRSRFGNSFDEPSHIRRIFVGPTPAAVQSSPGKAPRHLHRLTLAALMKPMVGQSALDSHLFRQTIQDDSLNRLLLAIWFLGAIVVVNVYTSVMTSQIVLPVFTNPPTTFQELADSGYELSAVAWTDNVEEDFKALNASYMHRFLEEAQDFNPIEPDCYTSVFDGHAACIGASKLIAFEGMKFIVDPNGEPRFRQSKDTRFPVVVNFAVSHYYPLLYEPLNRMVESFWEAGFLRLWEDYQIIQSISVGKEKARRSVKSIGIKNKNDEEGQQSYLSGFLFRIILFGNALATLAYIHELINTFSPLLVQKVVNQLVGFVCKCADGNEGGRSYLR